MDNRVLRSFIPKTSLNPKIWEKSDGSVKMKRDVRDKLLEISYQFIEFLDVDIIVTDIVLMGSLSNYNWSRYSDIDLHVVANFSQYSEKQIDLYEKFFNLKKILFNQKHDIKLFGYEVELYVQDEAATHFSSGVYSVLFDDWSNKPKKESVNIDRKLLKKKTKQWMNIIDEVVDSIGDEDLESAKEILSKYKEKLKKYRTSGLEKNGEYSTENLVFKILRRNGYIEKLHNASIGLMDDRLSMNQ
jgi:hypothetical protein